MTVTELYRALEERIPRSLSCEWDNDGLLCCPNPEKQVKKVLVALDATVDVIRKAMKEGYDVILTHHPLIFHPIKSVEPSDVVAAKLIDLVRSDISVMSFHTRLDAVRGGVNDTLAARLGLSNVEPFGEEQILRIGEYEKEMTLSEFVKRVKEATGADGIQVTDAGVPVKRVAILGGSGSDDVATARLAGADTYLTGELSHHHFADAPGQGMNLLAAGHYHTEQPVCAVLAGMVKEICPHAEVTVTESNTTRLI